MKTKELTKKELELIRGGFGFFPRSKVLDGGTIMHPMPKGWVNLGELPKPFGVTK